MKSKLKIFAILLLVMNFSCKAPQMVQTPNDVNELKINEQQFINKPLINLLKQIKPEIKMGGASNDEGHQYFTFKFITQEQHKKNPGAWYDHPSLYVYVKDPIDWKWEQRPKGKELDWTKEDAEKYGDLTVIRIKVINLPKELYE